MGFRSSSSLPVGGLDVIRQVEARYPAMLFKQQVTAYVEKIYGILRDNEKKELTTELGPCVQRPTTSKAASSVSSEIQTSSNDAMSDHTPPGHWQTVIERLRTFLQNLQYNCVPLVLTENIFTQIFTFINVQLFNSLLMKSECCSFGNGEYVKAGLDELEKWCAQEKKHIGASWDQLKHIRQAIGFMVIHQKSRISYDDISNDLCPILTVQQLYRICSNYCDDKYGTQGVNADVISSMKELMTDGSNSEDDKSVLLEDYSSMPFSADNLSNVFQVKDFSGVKPATELLENQAFTFLQE